MYEEEKENHRKRAREKDFHFSGPSKDLLIRFYRAASIDKFVNTSQKVTENEHVFVECALFENFDESGIIRINNPYYDTKVLVSTSSFFNASSRCDGGCIYLSKSGSFVQYKICSYGCKLPYLEFFSGAHSYIEVTNDENHVNYVIESSFTQSTGRNTIMYHKYGSQIFSSINITNSKSQGNAAFESLRPYSLSTTDFSNFYNITSERRCCFLHEYNTHQFEFSNVINNTVFQNYDQIFCPLSGAELTIEQCFFKANKASYLYSFRVTTTYVFRCHIESDNKFTDQINIRYPKEMTEIILSKLHSSFLCEVISRNKKDSIIFPNICISGSIPVFLSNR